MEDLSYIKNPTKFDLILSNKENIQNNNVNLRLKIQTQYMHFELGEIFATII